MDAKLAFLEPNLSALRVLCGELRNTLRAFVVWLLCLQILIEELNHVLDEFLVSCTIKRMRHILVVMTFHVLAKRCELTARRHRPVHWNGGVRRALMNADRRSDILKEIHR